MDNSKLKIVYVINGLTIGGSEKVAIENINCISESKFEIHLVSLSPLIETNSIFSIIQLNKKIKIHYPSYQFYNDYSIFGYLKLSFLSATNSKGSANIVNLLNKLKPDVLHFHTSPRELKIGRVYLKKNHSTKLVFTDHLMRLKAKQSSTFTRFALKVCYRKLYKEYNIISVAELIQKSMNELRIYDKNTNNIVIANGVTPLVRKDASEKNIQTNSVIYISRLSSVKGHDILVKAWAHLRDIPDKKLFLIGPDELGGKIQELSKSLNCHQTINFVGASNETANYLMQSDIGVFPSEQEGLPLSLLEKMGAGLPVIVSDIPELTALVKHNYNGLIFKSGDALDLANNIAKLISDHALRKELGSNAKKFVSQHYNAEENCSKLVTFYKENLL